MKTSDLIGPALDWAVAKAQGCDDLLVVTYSGADGRKYQATKEGFTHAPSTNWAQGGPIIEREWIALLPPRHPSTAPWRTYIAMNDEYEGPTPLIAAMRCFVASKLGDEVEIPNELTIKEKA